MPHTPAGNLGYQLGQLVFGSPDDGMAAIKGQALGAQVAANLASQQDRLASARKARAEALIDESKLQGRQNYDPTAFLDPSATLQQRSEAMKYAALGDLASQAMAAMDTYSKGRTEQRRDMAMDAFQNGNTELGNLTLGVASGKPLETTSISGGEAFNKFGSPGQAVNVTPVGMADIRAKEAAAANSFAQASRAHQGIGADKAGNYQITTGADGTLYRVNKLTGEADPVNGAQGGGASLGNLLFKKDSLALQKGTGASQVTRGLDRLEKAVKSIAGNKFINGGPLDQYVLAPTQQGQEIEQATGAILPALTALTRVPGIGSQSDWEGRLNMMQLPSVRYSPAVNQRAIVSLRGYINDLRSAYSKAGLPFPEDAIGGAGASASPGAGMGDQLFRSNAAPQATNGARQAPDGHFYVPDPTRPGKYLRVDN